MNRIYLGAIALIALSTTTLGCDDTPSRFLAEGIQQDLEESALFGWTKCYEDVYTTEDVAMSDVLQDCTGALLLIGCRPVGETALTLAAMGSRGDVLFDCAGTEDCSHLANGVEWYYSDRYSWGFAPAGEPVHRDSCDVNRDAGTAELRMCWHTTPGDGAGYINNGFRCGDNNLNSDSGWERLIFTAE